MLKMVVEYIIEHEGRHVNIEDMKSRIRKLFPEIRMTDVLTDEVEFAIDVLARAKVAFDFVQVGFDFVHGPAQSPDDVKAEIEYQVNQVLAAWKRNRRFLTYDTAILNVAVEYVNDELRAFGHDDLVIPESMKLDPLNAGRPCP